MSFGSLEAVNIKKSFEIVSGQKTVSHYCKYSLQEIRGRDENISLTSTVDQYLEKTYTITAREPSIYKRCIARKITITPPDDKDTILGVCY